MPLFQYAGFELISISGCPNIGVHRPVLLCFLLPSRAITFEEIIKQMKIRHRKRRDSIEFAFRKQLESEYESASL